MMFYPSTIVPNQCIVNFHVKDLTTIVSFKNKNLMSCEIKKEI